MQNLPLSVGLVGLSGGDVQRVATALDDGRIAVHRHESLEQLGEAAPLSNGLSTTNGSAVVAEDCLVVVGSAASTDTLEAIKQASQQRGGAPVVLAIPSPTTADAVAAMRSGTHDVIDTTADAATLQEAVWAAANEGRRTAPRRRLRADLGRRLTQLTQAEQQVLDAMLDGMANKQIAQQLQIGLRTVELRRSKIMKKMQARNLAELIKFICQAAPSIYLEPQPAPPPVENATL